MGSEHIKQNSAALYDSLAELLESHPLGCAPLGFASRHTELASALHARCAARSASPRPRAAAQRASPRAGGQAAEMC